MRVQDLNIGELLRIETDGGMLRFADHRVLLDAGALGLLRKYLVDNFGVGATRTVLTQFGYAHGWRMADAITGQFEWETTEERRVAVTRLFTLQGLFRVAVDGQDPFSTAGAMLVDSLRFFTRAALKETLDASLETTAEALKATEEKLRRRRLALDRALPGEVETHGLVAHSKAMAQVVGLARRIAKFDSTALITGESGTGKERIARLIHEESTRSLGPFIAVNCGAIPETLLESELFGHVRGAFTGASQHRPGLFEAASRGTLMLDEVGDISPGMQLKLLRVIQEREVRRVGDNISRTIDVRVLAATNKDLLQAVAAGTFRQDLYYRLKVIDLHVPALRDRKDDILALARLLMAAATLRMKREITGMTCATSDQLLRYSWPGNVRELENAMERAVALARGNRVELEDLPEEVRQAGPKGTEIGELVRPLEDVAKEYILAALAANKGNQTHTADQLGIGSATLYRKLKSYGLIPGRVVGDKPPSQPGARVQEGEEF